MGVSVCSTITQQYVASKGCEGLLCKTGCDMGEGQIIAVVPFWCCLAPRTVLASPHGDTLHRALGSYEMGDGVAHVKYAHDSALLTAGVALATTLDSPVKDYLHYISPRTNAVSPPPPSDSPEKEKISAQRTRLRALNRAVMHCIHTDLSRYGLDVSDEVLQTAHAVCESRCVDVPYGERVFGGPVLVPFFDLINHDDDVCNVAGELVTSKQLVSRLRGAEGDGAVTMTAIQDNCPFYVVVQTTRDIAGGDELGYHYLDPTEDAELYHDVLYWYTRFGFVPPSATMQR